VRKPDDLEALAHLAVAPATEGDGALSRATRIVGAVIGSEDVRLFVGDGVNYDGYPRRDEEDFFGLSPDGLLSASQELRKLARAAIFTIGPDGQAHDMAPADGKQVGSHIAFTLWTGATFVGDVIARGPWAATAGRRAGQFLMAAGPALAGMLELVVDADRTERLQRQMNALADVARVFTRAQSMRRVIDEIVSAINSATGFLCSLDLLDVRGRIGMRSAAASRFTGTPLHGAWLALLRAPDPIREMIVKNHQPVVLPDLQNDPRISEEARDFYRRASIVSAATVPLLFNDEVVGLLRAASLKPTPFDPPTVGLLQNLALQAAVAVKGVQLWSELQRSQKRLRVRNQELLSEISERERAEVALREQMRRDSLTGVLNHAALVAELRNLVSGDDNAPCAVVMIDVDDLKVINDTFGHQVGDEVLVAVARGLDRNGAIVGRYGGDEFTALLPGADRDAAESYRGETLNALAGLTVRDRENGAVVPLAVSMGIATYPLEAGRIEELISLADSGMYAMKRQRPIGSTGVRRSQLSADDSAAKMVGHIVPLLTSAGDLDDKLRLVARRLSVAAGYDAVNFGLFKPDADIPATMNTFGQLPENLVAEWHREQLGWNGQDPHPIRRLLNQGHPIIFNDPQHDDRLTANERELLCAGDLRSALVAPMVWQNELIGMLSVASKRENAFTALDAQFLVAVATQVTAIVSMATVVDQLQLTSSRLAQAHTETVMLLAAAAEAHDRTTGKHLRNVCSISERLARAMGWDEEDANELGLAAVLHDIGKIRVADSVLANTGRLSPEEWELMKRHAVWGEEFLAGRPDFVLAATIARSHHERWDGGGYPDGLSDDHIPDAAAIVAVADSFDAITSDRPYRPRRSVAAAMREIVACSGEQFSPQVVQAMMRLYKRRMLPHPNRHAPEDAAAA